MNNKTTATILVKKIVTLDYLYISSGKPDYSTWVREADYALNQIDCENYTPAHEVIEQAQMRLGIH